MVNFRLASTHNSTVSKSKSLFSYSTPDAEPSCSHHPVLSPYLIPADSLKNRHLVVREASRPINNLKRIVTGTKLIDGGHYIFSAEEMRLFLSKEPRAKKLFRPFVGTTEFLTGQKRFMLYLPDDDADLFERLPEVRKVISDVRNYRLAKIPQKGGEKKLKQPNALHSTPRKYHLTVIPESPFLVVPEVTSERREYVPIGWLKPPTIPSNLVKVLLDATLVDFAILTSSMHMAWLRTIGGRLDNRYRYSIGLVYNNFPLPDGLDQREIEGLAQLILKQREASSPRTLESMYDPDLMPSGLRKAHQALDSAIDKAYRRRSFSSDTERVVFLLGKYEELIKPARLRAA